MLTSLSLHTVQAHHSPIRKLLLCLFSVTVEKLNESLGKLHVADFAVLVLVEVCKYDIGVLVSNGQAGAQVP